MMPQNSEGTRVLGRQEFVRLLNIALDVGAFRFLRQAALVWLNAFPGDLSIQLVYGTGLIAEGKMDQGLNVLEEILAIDPEFLEAQESLSYVLPETLGEKKKQAEIDAYILDEKREKSQKIPGWAENLKKSIDSYKNDDLDSANEQIAELLEIEPLPVLVAIHHVRLKRASQEWIVVQQLSEIYHERWPSCLQFMLFLAESKIEMGEDANPVKLMHTCISQDAAGQVAERLWGANHPFRPLWRTYLEIQFDLPIPADVSALMGYNILATGDPGESSGFDVVELEEDPDRGFVEEEMEFLSTRADTPPGEIADQAFEQTLESHPMDEDTVDVKLPKDIFDDEKIQKEDIRDFKVELEKLGRKLRKSSTARADGRFPIYVILTIKANLVKQYGKSTADVIEREMQKLAVLFQKRQGWGAMVYMPDNAKRMAKLGIPVLETIDPWKIKLAVSDLDGALGKRGEMIGSMLIIGGPEIVPFHSLPNPTDDSDADVPSDNPYATLDTNYFIPEWPIGRLPGEAGTDAGLLLAQLRSVVAAHERSLNNLSWARRFSNWLKQFGEDPLSMLSPQKKPHNFGYSAAIWRRSSLATFRPIGEGKHLVISPPEFSGSISAEKISTARLGYFNLHGLPDAAEWFGQRDVLEAKTGPDYPIALSQKDLIKTGRSPEVVFSEACYGAFILGKNAADSMALKFIDINTRAFVGSTCISYGSINAPLIGADLLGNLFWKFLLNGSPSGEALMRAKIELVREMNKRQGYLDGEDQKTIISFVLYGDPFLGNSMEFPVIKSVYRENDEPDISIICDRKEEDLESGSHVTNEALASVKEILEPYLPGIDKARIHICQQQPECTGDDHRCPSADLGQKVHHPEVSENVVVTISKEVKMAQYNHTQFARVTLDPQGKMVKLAISK